MLDMLHSIQIPGVIEALVFDLPLALGPSEERLRRKSGDGKMSEPFGLYERSILAYATGIA